MDVKIVGVVASPLSSAHIRMLKAWADICEIRVDLLGVEQAQKIAQKISKHIGIITTVRAKDEGGKEIPERAEVFKMFLPYSTYIDVEINHKAELEEVIRMAKDMGIKIIASYHNFERMPDSKVLWKLVDFASEFADIAKFALWGDSEKHITELAYFTQKAKNKIKVATMLVGPSHIALLSRIVCSAFGSHLAYGAITSLSAPGQPNIKILSAVLKPNKVRTK